MEELQIGARVRLVNIKALRVLFFHLKCKLCGRGYKYELKSSRTNDMPN